MAWGQRVPFYLRLGYSGSPMHPHSVAPYTSNHNLSDLVRNIFRAVVACSRKSTNGSVREQLSKERQEVLGAQRAISLSPDRDGRLFGDRRSRRSVRSFESVSRCREALGPADRSRGFLRRRKRRGVGLDPFLCDDFVALEAVELERRKDVVVQAPQYLRQEPSASSSLGAGLDRSPSGKPLST